MGCNCGSKSRSSMNSYMNLYPSFEKTSKISYTESTTHPLINLENKAVVYRTPDNKKMKTFSIKPSMLRGFNTMMRK